jgi:hypothetical protein
MGRGRWVKVSSMTDRSLSGPTPGLPVAPETHGTEDSFVSKPRDRRGSGGHRVQVGGEGVGRRHKLGGTPDWLQRPDVPICEDCQEEMTSRFDTRNGQN